MSDSDPPTQTYRTPAPIPEGRKPFINADGRLDVIAWLGSKQTHDELAEFRAAQDGLKESLAEAEDRLHKQEIADEVLKALHVLRMLLPVVPLPEKVSQLAPIVMDAADGIIKGLSE